LVSQTGASTILLLAAASLLLLFPVYPAETTEYHGWFGPPGLNFRYENGTTYHPFTEVVGGGFDWTTTRGNCITDAGGWSHYRSSPLLVFTFGLAVAGLWLLLLRILAHCTTERGRGALLSAIVGVLVAASSVWLAWYGLLAASCPPDLGLPRRIAAGLTLFCLAVGLTLAVSRRGLARQTWRLMLPRPRERIRN